MRIALTGLLCAAGCIAADLQAVPSLDLQKYAGKWFEIARYPNRFQRDCASDVSANYTLRPDGKITVVNSCRKANGEMKSSDGTAKLANAKGPKSKLRVTFFWPFYGDYWVIALDPSYRWAIVGEPSRKYLWILSRSARMEDAEYSRLLEMVRERGYDPNRLQRTVQQAAQ